MSHRVLEVCVKKYAASRGKASKHDSFGIASYAEHDVVFVLCVARAYTSACVYVRGKQTIV